MPVPTQAQLSALYASINNSSAFSASQRANALSSVNNAYGGGSSYINQPSTPVAPPRAGTTGNAAGSQTAVAAPKPPASGTTGNAAGSGLPTGTVAKNMTAANAATSVVGPKKPDWMSQMEAINKTSGPINMAGTNNYGMTKTPVAQYQTPNPSGPNYQLQSNGGNVPNTQTPTSNTSGYGTANVLTNAQNAIEKFKSNNGGSSSSSSTPLADNNWQSTLNNVNNFQGETPKSSVSSYGLTNVAAKTPSLSEQQAQQGIVDETKKQADAAAAAAKTATTDEDKQYYTNLYNQAKADADKAESDYQALMTQSAEEQSTKAQLDSELQALQMGKTDVAGQPIPLSFITGQQSALERRSLDRTAPLTSKLGQLQAARQAALSLAQERKSSAQNKYNTAESNLTSYSAEQRKRQQDAADKAVAQSNIDRTFEENKRQYGLNYANQQRELDISQQNANTNALNAGNKGTTDVQLKQEINRALSTPEFQSMSTAQKRNYILSQGGDPADFNL